MITTLIHWFLFVYWVLSIPFSANVFEWNVHPYQLPELVGDVEAITDWEAKRKPELIALFEKNVYGALPTEAVETSAEVLEEGIAFEGTNHEAYRKQVALTLSRADHSITLQILTYVPVQNVRASGFAQRGGEGYPAVVSLNFFGNHSVTADPEVLPSRVWSQRIPGREVLFKEESRNSRHGHLPAEEILAEGYAVVTAYYGDIDPDFDDGFKNGVHALYPEYAPGSWGSISAWSWGMSRVMDYLKLEASSSVPAAAIDPTRVALFGFSRLGKSVLWAAANDSRFAAAISDSAGEGGDTLSRRNFGESTRLMTLRFPHWFPDSYEAYAGREDELPIDQHMLLSLIAPRPLLVSAATGDWWSDPKGAGEAVSAARAAYQLYERNDALQYELHEGGHNVALGEWEKYLSFLHKYFMP